MSSLPLTIPDTFTSGARAVRKAADRNRRAFAGVVVFAARKGQQQVDLDEVTKALEMKSEAAILFSLGPAIAMTDQLMARGLPPLVLKTVSNGFTAEANAAIKEESFRAAQDIRAELTFDAVNPEAVIWAEQRSAALITEVNATTQEAIRGIIATTFNEGIPPRQAANLLKPSIGLTPQSADAVVNLRSRMLDPENFGKTIKAGRTRIKIPESGPTQQLINRRTDQYAERLLRQRAVLIARTETIAASNEGQRQLWVQAQKRGLLAKTATKEWIVTPDDRLCFICEPLEGDTAPINEPYPRSGLMGPPAHPACRCAQGITISTAGIRRVA